MEVVKEKIINIINPHWVDLSDQLYEMPAFAGMKAFQASPVF